MGLQLLVMVLEAAVIVSSRFHDGSPNLTWHDLFALVPNFTK
jgi:hypothetical protein